MIDPKDNERPHGAKKKQPIRVIDPLDDFWKQFEKLSIEDRLKLIAPFKPKKEND